jgi:hypothetical protein
MKPDHDDEREEGGQVSRNAAGAGSTVVRKDLGEPF